MRKRLKGERPAVSAEARWRIREFVRELAALQKRYKIALYVDDCSLNFIDDKRTDEWDGYGQWDAYVYSGRVGLRALVIEDFSGWEDHP